MPWCDRALLILSHAVSSYQSSMQTDIGRRVQDQIQLQSQRRQQMHQAQAALAQGQPHQQVKMPSAQPAHRPHPLAQTWTPSEPNTPLAASSSQQIAAISPNRAAVSQAIVSPGFPWWSSTSRCLSIELDGYAAKIPALRPESRISPAH